MLLKVYNVNIMQLSRKVHGCMVGRASNVSEQHALEVMKMNHNTVWH